MMESVSMNIGGMSGMQGMGQGMRKPPPPKDGAEVGSDEHFEQISTQLIEENDGDGNGSLSIDEIGFEEEEFTQADQDGDGELSQEELFNGAKAKHQDMMTQMSMNGGFMDGLSQGGQQGLQSMAMDAYTSQMSTNASDELMSLLSETALSA